MKKITRMAVVLSFICLSANIAFSASVTLKLINECPDAITGNVSMASYQSPTFTLVKTASTVFTIDNPSLGATVYYHHVADSGLIRGKDVYLWHDGKPINNVCTYKKCTSNCFGSEYLFYCKYN